MQIESGMFKGVEIPDTELVPYRDDNDQIRFKADGSPAVYWPSILRTPHFLEKFSPCDGWQVLISNEDGRFNLPDRLRDSGGDVVNQPTVLFTAQLVKEGIVFATATSLAAIWGPKAWEVGESIVRGRLYDALGLYYPGTHDQSGGNAPANAGGEGAQGQGKVVAIGARQSAKPAPAADAQPSAEPQPAADAGATEGGNDVGSAEAASAPAANSQPVAASSPVRTSSDNPNSHIESNLLRQIEVQAASRGVEMPVFADQKAAKTFYRELLTGQHDRKAS